MRPSQPSGDPPVLLSFRVIDLLTTTLHRVLPWLLALWLLTQLRATFLTLSGAENLGAAWLQLLGGANRTRGFAFVFGIMGVIYGFRQRDLRHAAVERISRRMRALEQRVSDAE